MWYCNYVTWGKKDDHIIEQYRHIYIYIHVSFEDTYLNISTHIFYHITIYHFKYCNIWTIMHTSAYCTYINTTSHLYVYVYMHTYIYICTHDVYIIYIYISNITQQQRSSPAPLQPCADHPPTPLGPRPWNISKGSQRGWFQGVAMGLSWT